MTQSPDRPLDGQVALVTGGAGGIGLAACQALRRAGAVLAIADRDAARIEVARAALGDDTLGMTVDVTDEAAVEAMARTTVERLGRIDILVACAGILRAPGAAPRPVAQMTAAEWDAVLAVNLRGTFLCNRAVLGPMIRQRRGQIVNVSSTSGLKGKALDGAYCASKFGVIGLTESLAEEVRPHNIRVQAILPDVVATPIWEQNGPFGAPAEALPAERVGDLICYLVTLPPDTMLQALVVSPFRGRRKKVAPAPQGGGQEGGTPR